MNRALMRVALACLVMFVLLLLNVNYLQGFRASTLAGETGNVRVFDQQFTYQRGAILAAGDGTDVKIAESRLIKGSNQYQRYYPYGKIYAPITGYDSIYGKTGIEETENSLLAGTSSALAVHNFTALLTGKQKQGATVELTVSPSAQTAAYQAIASQANGHDVGLVAINPSTGAILALASSPTFNPNELTTLDGTQLVKNDNRLLRDPSQPLLNRATQVTLPPGSTFKIVTSAAAFSAGKVANTSTTIPAPTVLTLPNGHQLHNDNNEVCGNGRPPIIEAFYLSCDTAFGALGMRVTAPVLRQQSTRFGMNQPMSIPLPVVPSVLPEGPGWTDKSLTAYTAIGQYNDSVTPLQEALFAAAIANHGTLMQPYLVQRILGQGLSVISSHQPSVLSQPVSRQVAGYIQAMMAQVTANPSGTAYATAGPQATGGIVIDGKTGTAQNGVNATGLDDAVFSCFVPGTNGNPSPIAVGVMVKGGGYGADAAAPLAVAVIKAFMARHP